MENQKKNKHAKLICLCGKNNCILRSKESYKNYKRIIILKHVLKQCCKCKSCNPTTILDHNSNTAITFTKIKVECDVLNSYACDLAKAIIKYQIDLKDLLTSHNKSIISEEEYTRLKTLEVNYSKLKDLYNISLNDSVQLRKTMLLKDLNNELVNKEKKLLKTENKKLKNLIISFEYSNEKNKKNIELDNLINPDDHECLDDDLELNNSKDALDTLESKTIMLKSYDSIIHYLIKANISIGGLFYRMNLNKSEIKNNINKFIDLKIRRVAFAHPKPLFNIENDLSLLTMLNSI